MFPHFTASYGTENATYEACILTLNLIPIRRLFLFLMHVFQVMESVYPGSDMFSLFPSPVPSPVPYGTSLDFWTEWPANSDTNMPGKCLHLHAVIEIRSNMLFTTCHLNPVHRKCINIHNIVLTQGKWADSSLYVMSEGLATMNIVRQLSLS